MTIQSKQQVDKGSSRSCLMSWLKLMLGFALVFGLAALLASGVNPPGVWGEVLRHNRAHGIDASPFFFGDVENMAEYETGVLELRSKAVYLDRVRRKRLRRDGPALDRLR